MSTNAFFIPRGATASDTADTTGEFEVFEPTALTASVWADTMQHGAPPAALLVRAMEPLVGDGRRISRVTIDILGVVPISTVRTRAWVSRPGRTISMLTAELECVGPSGEFRTVARAQAWVLAASDTEAEARDTSPQLPFADHAGEPGAAPQFFDYIPQTGFIEACEWRFLDYPDSTEPRRAWIRARVPLVADEQPSPLVQVFSVVDAANGISAYLDPATITWMNMDMVVHLHRSPDLVDGWVGLVGDQLVGAEGIGTTLSRIYDHSGAFAVGAQTLLVSARANPS